MNINELFSLFIPFDGRKEGYLFVNKRGKPLHYNDYVCEILSAGQTGFGKSLIFDYLSENINKQLLRLFRTDTGVSLEHLNFELKLPAGSEKKKVKLDVKKVEVDEQDEAVFLLLFFDKQEKLERLQKKEKFRKSLSEIQDFERNYAGKVMHESIAQELYAIRIRLQHFLLSYGFEEQILPIKRMLNDTVVKVRDLSNTLRPSVLYDLGFSSAIDDLVFHFRGRDITFKVGIDPRISTVGTQTHYSAYRIIQEMLNKCANYPNLTKVNLDLKMKERMIVITFDVDQENFASDLESSLNRVPSMDIMKNRIALYSGAINTAKFEYMSRIEIKMCL